MSTVSSLYPLYNSIYEILLYVAFPFHNFLLVNYAMLKCYVTTINKLSDSSQSNICLFLVAVLYHKWDRIWWNTIKK